MKRCEKEIPKEIYDRAMEHNGFITGEDYQKVFTVSECMGYGVYNEQVVKDGERYLVRYNLGDSCD